MILIILGDPETWSSNIRGWQWIFKCLRHKFRTLTWRWWFPDLSLLQTSSHCLRWPEMERITKINIDCLAGAFFSLQRDLNKRSQAGCSLGVLVRVFSSSPESQTTWGSGIWLMPSKRPVGAVKNIICPCKIPWANLTELLTPKKCSFSKPQCWGIIWALVLHWALEKSLF